MEELKVEEQQTDEQQTEETPKAKKQVADRDPDHGNTLKFMLPSGYYITIREQNGEDDDVISRVGDQGNANAINKFIARILLENEGVEGRATTPNDVKLMKLKDKYYILLKSRILSLGSELKYKYSCQQPTCKTKTSFEEDLSKYDWDLATPIPAEGEEGYDELVETKYHEEMVTPYVNGVEVERIITLASKKRIKYKYLTGLGEAKALEYDRDSISRNLDLITRELQLEGAGGNWVKLQVFNVFTAREMAEIRSDVRKNDRQFEIRSEITCPGCHDHQEIPLIAMPDFFFPEDI